ncbi:hypothetical protein BJ878DRAFT_429608, partial [Calycina marina]
VTVCNISGANHESVAEHAIALYFAPRRNLVGVYELIVPGKKRTGKGSLAKGLEISAVWALRTIKVFVRLKSDIAIGNRVANIGKALKMKVMFAERRVSEVREGRTKFTKAIRATSVLMNIVNLSPVLLFLIGAAELSSIRAGALLINLSRGGIVHGSTFVDALKEKNIASAARRVYHGTNRQK